MNRGTNYNKPDGTNRGGRMTQSLLRHTAQRQVARPMEFRGSIARDTQHSSGGWRLLRLQAAQIQEELFKSYPTIPDHATQTPTTHKLHRTHFSNNDWNDNHFRTGHVWRRYSATCGGCGGRHVGRWATPGFQFSFDVTSHGQASRQAYGRSKQVLVLLSSLCYRLRNPYYK